MTDTTDIAALRSEAANIIGLLTAEGHQSFSLDKAADFFDDVFRLLEAERQRSAGSEEDLHKALHREKAAERKLLAAHEEIAALKAKLSNPVVLEYRKHDGFTDPEKVRLINAVTDRCAVAIKESGFTVKEGQ